MVAKLGSKMETKVTNAKFSDFLNQLIPHLVLAYLL